MLKLINIIYANIIYARGFVNELIERARRSEIFKRDKKSLEVKILATLLYFLDFL